MKHLFLTVVILEITSQLFWLYIWAIVKAIGISNTLPRQMCLLGGGSQRVENYLCKHGVRTGWRYLGHLVNSIVLDHTLMVSDCSGLSGAEDLHLKQGPNMVTPGSGRKPGKQNELGSQKTRALGACYFAVDIWKLAILSFLTHRKGIQKGMEKTSFCLF